MLKSYAAEVAAAFDAALAAQPKRYAAESDAASHLHEPLGFELDTSSGRLRSDTPRGLAADKLIDDGRQTEADRLMQPGLVAADSRGRVRRGMHSSRDVETAYGHVLDHLHDWSGGQYEPPSIGLHHNDSPEHVTVSHHDQDGGGDYYDEEDGVENGMQEVHYRDLGDHLADVLDEDVNRGDYGWNTDGVAEASAEDIGIEDDINQLPLRSHIQRQLHELSRGHSLGAFALHNAETQALRLAEAYEERVEQATEAGEDEDNDDVRESSQNAAAARRVAAAIGQHLEVMSKRQEEHGKEFDDLLKQLREAPHVVADPSDTDE